MATRAPQPVLFVSHGAAVCTMSPDDANHRFLVRLGVTVSQWQPSAIVVISAHFASSPVSLTGEGALDTIHDHPVQALYSYSYPGRGDARLTAMVQQALQHGGVETRLAPGRGLDHGAWVPLSLLLPRGDVPVMQVSLDAGLSPERHVALGRALAALRNEGVLLLGSGGLTHNQPVFRGGYLGKAEVSRPQPFSAEFDAWVSSQVTQLRGDSRSNALAAFQTHPLATQAHPTTEHFMPLLTICGAAGDDEGLKLFEGFQHSLSTSAFQFGQSPRSITTSR